MKQLLKVSHKLWVDAQLRAPYWAQRAIISRLHDVKEIARLRSSLTVYRLTGKNQGGPLTVDYVGLSHKPTLVDALFTEEPTCEEFGRVATWRAGTLADLSGSDLVVVAGGTRLVRQLPSRNAIVLPFFVRMILNVRGTWDDVRARLHKSARRQELRFMRKYGYEYCMSTREEDFELFYHTMYVPTIKLRKGDLASPMSFQEAHQRFRNGYLFMIKRDGRNVAGALSHNHGRDVWFRLMGVVDGDEQLIRQAALGACYYTAAHWANQAGFEGAIFGGCVPQLGNSVFQYKRKWGATVTDSDSVRKRIWIKVQRDTPAVRQFFKDNPFIIVDDRGQLQGLVVTDNPDQVTEADRSDWSKAYATPGLGGILIRSVADLLDGGHSLEQKRESLDIRFD